MADKKISELTAVTDVVSGDEYVVSRSGNSRKIDADDLSAGIAALYPPSGGGIFDAYAYLRDEKTAGTDGGTFSSGSWVTRDLNTEVFDTGSFVTLSSNQFTLAAGTYLIKAKAPAHSVNWHKLKLRNISDSTDAIIGSQGHSSASATSSEPAFLTGRITIGATKTFAVQHQCQQTKTTNGLGVNTNFGLTEVYTEVEIWREA